MRQSFRVAAIYALVIAILVCLSSTRNVAGMATSNGVITVTTNKSATCIANNGTLSFGTYLGRGLTATGSFSMICTEGANARIYMNNGSNTANLGNIQNTSQPVTRVMASTTAPPNYLGYDLFYDPVDQSADTNPWNNTTDFLTVYFGYITGVTSSGLKITDGDITGTGGTPVSTGTPGIKFTVGAGGTSSTGQAPSVVAGSNSGGMQTVTINVYGLIPAINPLPPAPITGSYSDTVQISAMY